MLISLYVLTPNLFLSIILHQILLYEDTRKNSEKFVFSFLNAIYDAPTKVSGSSGDIFDLDLASTGYMRDILAEVRFRTT